MHQCTEEESHDVHIESSRGTNRLPPSRLMLTMLPVYITIQYQAVMARQALHFLSDGISFSDTPSNWWSSLGRGPTTPTLDAPGVACRHLLNLLTEVTNSRSNARLVRNEIAARGSSMLPRRTSAGFLLGGELERVEIFKYLSLMLAYNGNDTQAMQVNLKKVWTCWV